MTRYFNPTDLKFLSEHELRAAFRRVSEARTRTDPVTEEKADADADLSDIKRELMRRVTIQRTPGQK
ncbi:hypothetical protein [Paraburkholderia sediminicola]|uniref:hypothetical protein n=1 Tax=Paraburkholderia sediminicola TaxID=458836 RepID=UPI0038B9DC3D